jgi:pimeloyl-ACP methyl ester carboxylesterase
VVGKGALVATWVLTVSLAAGCGGGAARRVVNPGRVATTVRPAAPTTAGESVPTSATSTPPDAPATPTTTALPARPPYAVTETTLHLVDRSRPTVSHGRTVSPVRTLTTLVWLPPAPGPRPLIVFAHGFNVGPDSYLTLLQAWAAHGYVVAAPEFPLTDPAISGPNLDEDDINNQPADLRYVTHALVSPGSPVAAQIDPRRVAVTGHSDGAESALAASLLPVPAGQPSYRALIAMSVQPLPGSGPTANPPILVTQGDADTINPPAWGGQTWQQAASPKYLLILHGGGHLPPLQAGSAWLPGVEAVTEAFLDAYVGGFAPASNVTAAAAGSSLLTLQTG